MSRGSGVWARRSHAAVEQGRGLEDQIAGNEVVGGQVSRQEALGRGIAREGSLLSGQGGQRRRRRSS